MSSEKLTIPVLGTGMLYSSAGYHSREFYTVDVEPSGALDFDVAAEGHFAVVGFDVGSSALCAISVGIEFSKRSITGNHAVFTDSSCNLCFIDKQRIVIAHINIVAWTTGFCFGGAVCV